MKTTRITRRTWLKGALGSAAALGTLGLPLAQSWAQQKSGEPAVPTEAELEAMLKRIDERQRSVGDYKALAYLEQRQKGRADLVYETVVYRRDEQEKLMILFLKPKSEAGKGYLRLDQNLFLYDPSVGKWERRTDRESIGGTSSQRRDFDASNFSRDYKPAHLKVDTLGKLTAHHIELTARPGREVAYPRLHLWVEPTSETVLKVQEFALSGKLMRTAYYPKWSKVENKAKGEDVFFPKEIRIFDEVEKGTSTTIVMQKVDLDELPDNIFTKAWLESKSR